MTKIVSNLLIGTVARVSPTHLPGNQLEKAAWGQAHAGQLFRVTNIRSGVDIQTANVPEGGCQLTDTGAVTLLPAPVIWRDQRGHDVCLNYACIERFAGVFNPDQLIEALVFDEQNLSEDAAHLIRFRFQFVDPALMPHSDRTDRAAWAHRLDDELSTNLALETLIAQHWLARENGKRLSATDRAGILENTVSARIFNPSYRNRRRASPDGQENDGSTQTKEPLVLESRALSTEAINHRRKHFPMEFEETFNDARDLKSIVRDLKEKHVQCGGDKVNPEDVRFHLITRDNFTEFKKALDYLCEYYGVSIYEQPGD